MIKSQILHFITRNLCQIDYQELMKHFEELYVMVKYHTGLQLRFIVKSGASLNSIGGRTIFGASPRQ